MFHQASERDWLLFHSPIVFTGAYYWQQPSNFLLSKTKPKFARKEKQTTVNYKNSIIEMHPPIVLRWGNVPRGPGVASMWVKVIEQALHEMKFLTIILFSALKVHHKTKDRWLKFRDILSSSEAISV